MIDIDPKDPTFPERLNEQLREYEDRIRNLEKLLKNGRDVERIIESSDRNTLDLSSTRFKDASLPSSKIIDKAITNIKLGDGSVDDLKIKSGRSLFYHKAYGLHQNILNGSFANINEATGVPEGWFAKVGEWGKNIRMNTVNAMSGEYAIELSGSEVVTLESLPFVVKEDEPYSINVEWGADSTNVSAVLTVKFRWLDENMDELGTDTALTKAVTSTSLSQWDGIIPNADTGARFCVVEISKAAYDFAAYIDTIQVNRVPHHWFLHNDSGTGHTLTAATWEAVELEDVGYNRGNIATTTILGGSPRDHKVTVRIPGLYLFTGQIYTTANVDEWRIGLYEDGAQLHASQRKLGANWDFGYSQFTYLDLCEHGQEYKMYGYCDAAVAIAKQREWCYFKGYGPITMI